MTIARFLTDPRDDKFTPLNSKGQANLVTQEGTMPGIVVGEALELSDYWRNNCKEPELIGSDAFYVVEIWNCAW